MRIINKEKIKLKDLKAGCSLVLQYHEFDHFRIQPLVQHQAEIRAETTSVFQ